MRVYYEDTDSGGVVYHSNYLKFLERARTEWLRSLGIEQDHLREQGCLFVVRKLNIEFLKAAGFNQLLEVTVILKKLGGASLAFEQTIRSADSQSLICTAEVNVVCVTETAGQFRACAIPAELSREMSV